MKVAWIPPPSTATVMSQPKSFVIFFFYNDPATTEFSPFPLHAALPILRDFPHENRRRQSRQWLSAFDRFGMGRCGGSEPSHKAGLKRRHRADRRWREAV